MKRVIIMFFIVSLVFFGVTFASPIYVPPEDGMLAEAIDFIASGDTLILESAGVYTATSMEGFMVNKTVVIRGEDDAEVMPRIEIHNPVADSMTANFFVLQDGGSLLLENVELWGMTDDATQYTSVNDFIILEENAKIGFVEINNCYLHHAMGNVIDGDTDGAVVETVIMDNCIVNMCNGGPEFKATALSNMIKITNSTFMNLSNRFVRAQPKSPESDAEGIIDHCTVYNVAGKRLIMGKGNTKKWLVTNTIFSMFTGSNADDCIRPGDNEADTLAFCILHSNVGLHKDWSVVHDTLSADPMFADPAGFDLTLLDGSPALTMADDGGPIGDPRWFPTTTAVNEQNALVDHFNLQQNYPNPFNPSTTIAFTLRKKSRVSLSVYNTRGQLIETLIDNHLVQGQHSVSWNAGNLASGVYFYKLQTDEQVAVRKMVLMQ